MSGAEAVVFAFAALGETAYPAFGAESPEGLAAAGENLVRVCLMAHVEHQLVLGRVEYVVHADYELDCAQAGRQVPGIGRTALDDIAADFSAELSQLRNPQALDVGRTVYLVKNFVHLKPFMPFPQARQAPAPHASARSGRAAGRRIRPYIPGL